MKIKLTEKENNSTIEKMKSHWNLGPEKASSDPKDNGEYWKKMASIWNVSEKEARRRLCSNCKYSCCSTKCLEEMESIPLNEYDKDGGGRTYCDEFEFICHNLRTCQDWESEDKDEDEDDYMMTMNEMLYGK